MSTAAVRDLLDNLPPKLQDGIGGYVNAVETALPEIARDANVRMSLDQMELFLFLVAVKRIWSLIEGQYNLIGNSIAVAETREFQGFQLGSSRYTRDSEAAVQSLALRINFAKLISDLELERYVHTRSLSELAVEVAGRSQ